MQIRTTFSITAICVTGFALVGCGRGAPPPPHAAAVSSTVATEPVPVASSVLAFQVAAARCKQTTPNFTTTLSPACAKVAEMAVTMHDDYAAGIRAVDTATMTVRADYMRGMPLPTSNAAANVPTYGSAASMSDPSSFAGTVTIGPSAGTITVMWAKGALAGKRLVATPMLKTARNASLCWQVDAAGTTVASSVRQLGPELRASCTQQ